MATSQLNPHRGRMVRSERQMEDQQAREFLRRQTVIHAGTCDASGWPYVVPLMYVYEGGDLLYLHTGNHQGHFLANVRENPHICLQADEPGPLQRGQPSPCNSALVYGSVIAYGTVQVLDGPLANQKKTWFLDRLLEKLHEPLSAYEQPGYPMLNRIILYEVTLEMITGKLNVGLHH